MTHGVKIVLALAVLLLAFGLSNAYAAPATLSGQVTYRERMALPAGSRLQVRLVDAQKPDEPTRIGAEAAITGPGGIPLMFNLNFDSAVINPARKYAIVAEIRTGEVLWFRNSVPYAVDPLAPAQPVSVVVDFIGQQLAPVDPAAGLYGVVWRAETIEGKPVPEAAEITLSVAEDGRAGGKGGCNNYFAQSRLENGKLDFSSVASTRMACAPTIMTLETRFFELVDLVAGFSLNAGTLTLSDEAGTVLMTFARTSEAAR